MIKLSEDYIINFDKESVVLMKKHVIGEVSGKKTERFGEIEWKDVGYFSTVKGAMKKYIELDIRNVESMEELIKRITELENKVNTLLSIKISTQD